MSLRQVYQITKLNLLHISDLYRYCRLDLVHTTKYFVNYCKNFDFLLQTPISVYKFAQEKSKP